MNNLKEALKLEAAARKLRREASKTQHEDGFEIHPTEELLDQLPRLRGHKFYLLKWLNDEVVSVYISDKPETHKFAATYFKELVRPSA